jgi:endogenous inhibitor of DNA gyrase (YacG/DUF329 family)
MTEVDMSLIYDLRIKGMGYKAIATITGLSRDAVRSYCRRYGLDGDPQVVSLNLEEKIRQNLHCACCHKPINQKGHGRARRFCSESCRRKWWNENQDKRNKKDKAIYKFVCPTCGKEFKCYGNKNRKYCSHDCFIKSRFWKEDEDGI